MINPLPGWVLIKKEKEQYSGVLTIPESVGRFGYQGLVLAVGDDVEEIKAGDRVYYDRVEAKELEDDQVMIKDKYVLGMIEV